MDFRPLSIRNLPVELGELIYDMCDAYTLSQVRQTCRNAKSGGQRAARIWFVAHQVFHDPLLYITPPLAPFRKLRIVAINALMHSPELLFHPDFPKELRSHSEMQKTALVSSLFLKRQELYETIQIECSGSFSDSFMQDLARSAHDQIHDGSELWKLHAFALHSIWSRCHYERVPDEIRRHPDIALCNVKNYPYILEYLPFFQDEEKLVTHLVKDTLCPTSIIYASPRLRAWKPLVRTALQKCLAFPRYVSSIILQHAHAEIQDDDALVTLAIQDDGASLLHMSPRLKGKEDMYLYAVNRYAENLKFVPPPFNLSRRIVQAAIRHDPSALKHAADIFKRDEELVIEAVRKPKWGWVLQYAHPDIQDSDRVVGIAVEAYGCALEFASSRLQDTDAIVIAAYKQNPSSRRFASPRMQAVLDRLTLPTSRACIIQ